MKVFVVTSVYTREGQTFSNVDGVFSTFEKAFAEVQSQGPGLQRDPDRVFYRSFGELKSAPTEDQITTHRENVLKMGGHPAPNSGEQVRLRWFSNDPDWGTVSLEEADVDCPLL